MIDTESLKIDPLFNAGGYDAEVEHIQQDLMWYNGIKVTATVASDILDVPVKTINKYYAKYKAQAINKLLEEGIAKVVIKAVEQAAINNSFKEIPKSKICTKCKQEKKADGFYLIKKTNTLASWCKKCTSNRIKSHYAYKAEKRYTTVGVTITHPTTKEVKTFASMKECAIYLDRTNSAVSGAVRQGIKCGGYYVEKVGK